MSRIDGSSFVGTSFCIELFTILIYFILDGIACVWVRFIAEGNFVMFTIRRINFTIGHFLAYLVIVLICNLFNPSGPEPIVSMSCLGLAMLDEKVEIKCEVLSKTFANIAWFYNGKPIKGPDKKPRDS